MRIDWMNFGFGDEVVIVIDDIFMMLFRVEMCEECDNYYLWLILNNGM